MHSRWTGGRALAALALLSLAGALGAHAQAPCRALEDAYSRNSDGSLRPARALSVYGSARTLHVAADARAPSRAAAALQLAALRALMRYSRDHTALTQRTTERDMCGLATRLQKDCEVLDSSEDVYDTLVLSPAMSWNGWRCSQFEVCLKNPLVPPRLQVIGAGAAPAALRLHAHLAAAAAAACSPAALLWDFYTDHTRFYPCAFTRDEKSTLATVYTLSNRIYINSELNRGISAAKLYLNVTSLEEDDRPRSELFRLLTERKSSFLFIDYDIWEDMPGVYKAQLPPPTDSNKPTLLDSMRSLRLADDFVLRPLAPETLQGLQVFSPTSKDIREVLEIEATNPQLGIEEAACSWATAHNATFKSWFQIDYKPHHRIAVFLCVNDPDKLEYKKVANAVKMIYNRDSELDLEVYFVEIDCADEAHLNNELIKTSTSYRWQRLIGAVAAGAGARAAAEHAASVQTALVLYDLPAAGVRLRLGEATRASSGTMPQLVAAVQHFLSSFEWTRLAILSDDTQLSKDLFDSFFSNEKLKVYNAVIGRNISDTLQSLQSLNARIFFVNTSPDVATNILCAAHRLGITSSAEYVWILREWRAADLKCDAGDGTVPYKPNISHYTISFWWRGGNSSQLFAPELNAQKNSNNVLRQTLDDLFMNTSGNTWPLLAAPLADSLEYLIKSFKKFAQLYPERYFDLHGNGAVKLLLESLKNQQINGVLQNLEYVNGSLYQPLVFMDRWIGDVREPFLVWRIQDDRVQPLTRIPDVYGDDRPSDGALFCLVKSSSQLFNPKCYDKLCFIALGFLIVTILAIYASRRVRLKRLAKRDSLLTAQLLAQREFVSNALVDHYVDRAALELYDYLSNGCFGRVRYAILRAPERQPVSVAVKELRDDVPLREESELLREACILATLCHDHVVRLIGVCATGGPLLVLMEYAFFGNLCEYLCERRHLIERVTEFEENDEAYHVSAPSLTRLASEVASALAYLALQRLVHRDIRASNCLVDARRSLKLANFGLARKTGTGAAGEEEYLTRRRGLFPVLWMAPESLERGVFSAASDAWALGVLLLEVVTLGARPYGVWPPLRVLQYVSAGGRPPLPPDVSESTRRILVQCWRRAPERRPAAAALAALLAADREALRPALLPVLEPPDESCPTIHDDVVTISL